MLNILVWLLLVFSNRKDAWNAAIWPILGTAAFWFFIGGSLVGNIINSNPSLYTTNDWLRGGWSIKSVKFDNRYTGSFFIWTGHIENHDYYYVFTDMGNNQWLKQKFPMEITYLREVDTQPRALEYLRTRSCNWYRKWFWGIDNFMDMSTTYVLEVPKGTIVEEYKP